MIKISIAAVAIGFLARGLFDQYRKHRKHREELRQTREKIKEFYTPEVIGAFESACDKMRDKHDRAIIEAMRVPADKLTKEGR